MTQLTWNNDPALKEQARANLIGHRAADQLVRGEGYLHHEEGSPRGCALGCTLVPADASQDRIKAIRKPIDLAPELPSNLWTEMVAAKYHLPVWLTKIEEEVFESLPVDQARDWPVPFVEAIPIGVPFTELDVRVRVVLGCEFDWLTSQVESDVFWPAYGTCCLELLRGVPISVPETASEMVAA